MVLADTTARPRCAYAGLQESACVGERCYAAMRQPPFEALALSTGDLLHRRVGQVKAAALEKHADAVEPRAPVEVEGVIDIAVERRKSPGGRVLD